MGAAEQGAGAGEAGTAGGPAVDLGGGVLMPLLGLGVWQMAAGTECEQAVAWAFEAGYRHIDTASIYRNERSVGAALAASGLPRAQVFVTTKWFPLRRRPRVELERSLERLGLEQVDLYLVHWPAPGRSARAWSEFEALKADGLARAIGVSNYSPERLRRLLGRASVPPAVDQVHFSPLHFPRSLLRPAAAAGVVLEAYSPLEQGRVLEQPTVRAVAGRVGRTPAQVALRWALQHGAAVIPKSARRERILENAALFDFELDAEAMAALDRVDPTAGA